MNNKIIGVLLGVAGIILWFMPFVSWNEEFMGKSMNVYQTGQHIGGIAYLLFLSSLSYAVLSWLEQHQLRIISACVSMGICILFLVKAGTNTDWGLISLLVVSLIGIWLAVKDNKKIKEIKKEV